MEERNIIIRIQTPQQLKRITITVNQFNLKIIEILTKEFPNKDISSNSKLYKSSKKEEELDLQCEVKELKNIKGILFLDAENKISAAKTKPSNDTSFNGKCSHPPNQTCINCIGKDSWDSSLYLKRKHLPFLAIYDKIIKTSKDWKSDYFFENCTDCAEKFEFFSSDLLKISEKNKNNSEIDSIEDNSTADKSISLCGKCTKASPITFQKYRTIDHITLNSTLTSLFTATFIKINKPVFSFLLGRHETYKVTDDELDFNTGTMAIGEALFFPLQENYEKGFVLNSNNPDFRDDCFCGNSNRNSKKKLKKNFEVFGKKKPNYSNFFEILKRLNIFVVGDLYGRPKNEDSKNIVEPVELFLASEFQNKYPINEKLVKKEYLNRQSKNREKIGISLQKKVIDNKKMYGIEAYNDDVMVSKDDKNISSLFVSCSISNKDSESFEVFSFQVSDFLAESVEKKVCVPELKNYVLFKKNFRFYSGKSNKNTESEKDELANNSDNNIEMIETNKVPKEFFIVNVANGIKEFKQEDYLENIFVQNNMMFPLKMKLFEIKRYFLNFFTKKEVILSAEDTNCDDSNNNILNAFQNLNCLYFIFLLSCKCESTLKNFAINESLMSQYRETYYEEFNIIIKERKDNETFSFDYFFENCFLKKKQYIISRIILCLFEWVCSNNEWKCNVCDVLNENVKVCSFCGSNNGNN